MTQARRRRPAARPPSRHPVTRWVTAALVGVVLGSMLSSCSVFQIPSPPGSVADASSTLQAALRKTPGVADVTVSIEPRGDTYGAALDDPGAWFVTARVTAEPTTVDAHPIADTIEDQLATARLSVPATATLLLSGSALPDTTFDFNRGTINTTVAALADSGTLLRGLTGIQTVIVSLSQPPTITISSPGRWVDTVKQLRALNGYGYGALTSVIVNTASPAGDDAGSSQITVGEAAPDDATLTGLSSIATQAGINDLTYDPVRPPDSQDDWRPTLTVATTSLEAQSFVVSKLTGFDEQAPPVTGIPRASFTVYSNSGDGQASDGYLGLPIGAAVPDDLVPVPKPPIDPAVEAATCTRNMQLVQTLVTDAGGLAGIAGVPSLTPPTCDGGSGTQVVGTMLLPVFQVADSADAAYAAITASWTSQGYTIKDKAGPTEFRSGGPLKQLTISGRQDGISITATSY